MSFDDDDDGMDAMADSDGGGGPSRQESQFSNWSDAGQPMDEDGSDEEGFPASPGPQAQASDEASTVCLLPKDLIGSMLKSIEEVNQVFQISPGTARILLAHFKWDKERLLERYFSGDQARLFEEAHVMNPELMPKKPKLDPNSEVDCEICMVPCVVKSMSALECGHMFCNECWNQYLRSKILDEGTACISCAMPGCDILVDELTMTRLISEPDVLRKYEYVIAKEFVSANKRIKWCPAPGCEHALQLPSAGAIPVRCSCGHFFCFQCLQAAHEPIRCEMLAHWLKKCADDSETANWIAANTKECPKCHSTIEKNGGCNHITCRQAKCMYEFCWLCLGPWEPHGSSWYNCNRFDEKDAKDARDAQDHSRHSLQRYLFYYNRYANHEQSKKLEKKLEAMVDRKMEDLQRSAHMSWIEVQFLKKALTALGQCRETLKFTYVFAYYLEKNNECVIFEDNQKDLEMATETLSHYLESDSVRTEQAEKLKQDVLDKTKYCVQRREKILSHVYDGAKRRAWQYQPASMQQLMEKLV